MSLPFSNSSIATIHNVRLDSQFTITCNATPADPNLSWAAKGLLWYLLSRPSDWTMHVWQLAALYKGEERGNGEKGVKSIVRELKKQGYITYTKTRNEFGHWCHRYDIYPMPVNDFQKMFPEAVCAPVVERKVVERPIITKTEKPKTDLDVDKTLSPLPVEKFATPEPAKPPKKPKVKQQDDGGTLPCSHSDWTLVSSKYKLSTEQSDTLHWLSSLQIDTTTETLAWWAKTYPMSRLEEVYKTACSKKVKSKGAYMQKLLKTNANVPTENSQANKAFAEEFKKLNSWHALEIKEKYAILHNGRADIEINFNMDQTEFVSYLIDKLKAFGKHEKTEAHLNPVMFEGYDD